MCPTLLIIRKAGISNSVRAKPRRGAGNCVRSNLRFRLNYRACRPTFFPSFHFPRVTDSRKIPLPKGFGTVSFHRLYNNEASHCVFLITINARGKYLCYSPFFFRGCISLDLLGGFLILVDRFSFERTKIVDNGIFYSKDKGNTVFVRVSTSVREII